MVEQPSITNVESYILWSRCLLGDAHDAADVAGFYAPI